MAVYQLVFGKSPVELQFHRSDALRVTSGAAADRDFRKIEIMDTTADDGRSITHNQLKAGRPIKPECVPTHVHRAKHYKLPIADYIPAPKKTAWVSNRFKDVVERFEPGVHQFFPVTTTSGGKEVAPHYLFIVCNRIDGLDHAACVPPIGPTDRLYSPTYQNTDCLVFNRAQIGGAHVWAEKREPGFWMSAEIRDVFAAAGVTGIKDTVAYDRIG